MADNLVSTYAWALALARSSGRERPRSCERWGHGSPYPCGLCGDCDGRVRLPPGYRDKTWAEFQRELAEAFASERPR